MAEKSGYPGAPTQPPSGPPTGPPPNYSAPYPPQVGQTNPGYAPPQYGQQYGQQYAPQYGMPAAQSTVIVTQPTHCAVATHIPDHMGLAIFATVLCFWPLGIVAIMRASEARSALARGDSSSAVILSEQSRRLSMATIGIGCVTLVIVIVAVAVSVSNSCYYYYC